MTFFFQKIKRNIWLYSSAQLSIVELTNILANRFIYILTKFAYCCHAYIHTSSINLIYDYRFFVPKNTKVEGRALIIFSRTPLYKTHFIGRMKFYFSNNGLMIGLVKALNELGLSVDVLDMANPLVNLPHTYDIVLVHHYYDIDHIKELIGPNGVPVYFETGSYWKTIIESVSARLNYFQKRHNLDTQYSIDELVEEQSFRGNKLDKVLQHSDGIIIVGDTMVKSYKDYSDKTFNVINGVYIDPKISSKNEALIETGRYNFLFFSGGYRNIEKGLDIVIDAAFMRPDINIYICSQISPEIQTVIEEKDLRNIHFIGYLKQRSKAFYHYINHCNYVIQPSSHEGVPGGVLDCMQYGLVPVISKACNIPTKNFGVIIEPVTVENIVEKFDFLVSQSTQELLQRSNGAQTEVVQNYNPDIFTNTIKKHIGSILSKK